MNRHNIPPVDFRNGDFSRATTIIYDPATGNADGTGRTPFPGNIIPSNRISPIAQRLLALVPAPNVTAALGQNNYEFLGVREKKTEAADVKLTYQASTRDGLAYRFSFQRPEVFDPGTYGVYGGPSNDGFAGTGTNKTFSTALNWTRTFGTSATLDTRAGFVYYHNIATAQGAGLNTSDEVGISGANLDEFTSGLTRFEVFSGYSNPVIGFSPSLPWDRSEKTYNVASTFTKIKGNHTFKAGLDVRHNRDFLLQVQDLGGSRGRYQFGAAQTASPADSASPERLRERAGELPPRSTLERVARSAASPIPARSTGPSSPSSTTSGRSPQADPGPRAPSRVLHAVRGPRGQGRALELRPRYEQPARRRVREHPRQPERQDLRRTTSRPRTGCRTGSTRRWSLRAGYGVSIMPVPRQPVGLQLPGQAEQPVQPARTPSPRRDGWRTDSRRR